MTDRIGRWLVDHVGLDDARTLVIAAIVIAVVMVTIAGINLIRIGVIAVRGPRRKAVDPHATIRAIAARETGNPYQSPLNR